MKKLDLKNHEIKDKCLDNSLPSCKIKLKINTIKLKKQRVASRYSYKKAGATHPRRLCFQKFNEFLLPGVYYIVNKKTKKRYIGEAANLAKRCGEHYTKLQQNNHDCKELQHDWNYLGDSFFDFFVLKSEISYKDHVKRLSLQRQLIQKYKDNCYNQLGKVEIKKTNLSSTTQVHNSIPVIVYGKQFPSISSAAAAYNISVSVAKNHLNDLQDLNWQYVDSSRRSVSNVACPIVIDGRFYPSVSMPASAYNITDKTLRKYIKERPNWCYFDSLTLEEQENILKSVSPTQSTTTLGSFRHGRRVNVGGTIYNSIKSAATAHKIDPRTVRKRINSKNFLDWSWADSS